MLRGMAGVVIAIGVGCKFLAAQCAKARRCFTGSDICKLINDCTLSSPWAGRSL